MSFWITFNYNYFNFLIYSQFATRMFYFLCPRNIICMKETVDTIFKRNKSSNVSYFYNFSLYLCTYWIFFRNLFPWIFSSLFETKRNTSFLNVISKNHCFNFLTNRNHIFWLVYFLCPREFTDMNKTFNSFFKFNKCTEFSKFCNLTLYDII